LKVDEAKESKAQQSRGAQSDNSKRSPSRAGKYQISIYDAWCKQCGLCVDFCPKKTLTIRPLESPEVTSPENCIGCMLCVMHCPDFAINVTPKEENGEKPEV
ncbi:MAG: 4Fe-4S dicluster domain-containing protein, partial [Armatimonadota bacterium]|nr:4Fe-4S dicluster domain-containing protein [Armatimonadota bacterium]